MEVLLQCWCCRIMKTCISSYAFITSMGFSITSIKGQVISIIRRVHKSLESDHRGFGVWGIDLGCGVWIWQCFGGISHGGASEIA